MTVLAIMIGSILFLGIAGHFYSHYLARQVGENSSRTTPAITKEDGRDYVPTPTSVVFAHHFAAIAGAGPIVGPVLAMAFGWLPALLWVLVGSVLIGAVHDYLATYMATREGGESMATIAKRLLGKNVFLALMFFLIIMLALVCATFLTLSASALTSMLPFDRIELPKTQTLFRLVDGKVVIGGIASMSVIVITAVAPLIGWMYIKKQVAVWKCSLVATIVCIISVIVGIWCPVAFSETHILGLTLSPTQIWIILLSTYVLIAAGVPVWLFLQSRDFVNVHILYVGVIALVITLFVAGFRGVGVSDTIPAVSIAEGSKAFNGSMWPTLFIVIACGAVSGFHSLCAGGTTCKQLKSEAAVRPIGYYGMLLESFLAVCIIGAMIVGAGKMNYLMDVHPYLLSIKGQSNPVLGFAMAVGNTAKLAFGAPIAIGALAGMILLEGFLVTTLDTAVRLMRYLFEEIWQTMFGQYDVFAGKIEIPVDKDLRDDGRTPTGSDGLPVKPDFINAYVPTGPAIPTSGAFNFFLRLIRHYWFNSGLAVVFMLFFAMSGSATALWGIFATSNQLLAAFVLFIASLWLLQQKRKTWFALIPALFMLATTLTSLIIMIKPYHATHKTTLLVADISLLVITAYLLMAGLRSIFANKTQTINQSAPAAQMSSRSPD
jgi:carbon starvation protein